MGGPNGQGSPPRRDPVASGPSYVGASSFQLDVSSRVREIRDSTVLALFERLRKEVDASFKRYEHEIHCVLQAECGDTSGHGSAGRSVALPNEANIGFAAVSGPVEKAAVDRSFSVAKRERTKRHQNILMAALEGDAGITVLQDQGTGSPKTPAVGTQDAMSCIRGSPKTSGVGTPYMSRIRKSPVTPRSPQTPGVGPQDTMKRIRESNSRHHKGQASHMNMITLVKDVASHDSETGLIDKVARFKFNAKPLVSKNSWLSTTIQNNAQYRNLLNILFLLDSLIIVVELQFLSYKMTNSRNVFEEPAFRFISLLLCLFFWADIFMVFTVEFPKVDLLAGRTGARFLMLVTLVQHTLDLAGAFALPDQRFTSTFRTLVGRVLFLRVIRTTVVLPGLAGASMRQRLGELHIMIRALTGTVQPLFWCVLMYFIILTIFGIYFTEGAVSHIVQNNITVGLDEPLVKGWGTLWKSVFSLSLAMLGGQDWGDIYDSLGLLAAPSKVGFAAFICFTHIALLNTVTAVFIKCAFLRFEHDREFVVQQELAGKREYLLDLKRIFSELDEDTTGSITPLELAENMGHPDVAAYFSKLGLDTDEVDKFFELMDEDGSGTISQEEFLWGCLRLHGGAKSLDLEFMQRDIRFVINRLLEIQKLTKALTTGAFTSGV